MAFLADPATRVATAEGSDCRRGASCGFSSHPSSSIQHEPGEISSKADEFSPCLLQPGSKNGVRAGHRSIRAHILTGRATYSSHWRGRWCGCDLDWLVAVSCHGRGFSPLWRPAHGRAAMGAILARPELDAADMAEVLATAEAHVERLLVRRGP